VNSSTDTVSSDQQLTRLADTLAGRLTASSLTLATAESCTGGWIAQTLTAITGSSAWFDRGFVTYSNQAKQDMLGVSLKTLDQFGAVSEQVVLEMVQGALNNSPAQLAVAVSGIAGPGGGTVEKPVGTVCFGWCRKGFAAMAESRQFNGDREAVRRQAVAHALQGLLEQVEAAEPGSLKAAAFVSGAVAGSGCTRSGTCLF